LNARYYEGSRGQFISQDPSFLAVGDPNKLKQVTGLDQQVFLADPQIANSTSYGRDNPITKKDPDGNCPICPDLYALFSPQVVGDRVFNADGSLSSTPQQATVNATVFVGGFLTGGAEAKAASGAAKATYSVYQGVDSAGVVRYVGITGRNALERFAEHGKAIG